MVGASSPSGSAGSAFRPLRIAISGSGAHCSPRNTRRSTFFRRPGGSTSASGALVRVRLGGQQQFCRFAVAVVEIVFDLEVIELVEPMGCSSCRYCSDEPAEAAGRRFFSKSCSQTAKSTCSSGDGPEFSLIASRRSRSWVRTRWSPTRCPQRSTNEVLGRFDSAGRRLADPCLEGSVDRPDVPVAFRRRAH